MLNYSRKCSQDKTLLRFLLLELEILTTGIIDIMAMNIVKKKVVNTDIDIGEENSELSTEKKEDLTSSPKSMVENQKTMNNLKPRMLISDLVNLSINMQKLTKSNKKVLALKRERWSLKKYLALVKSLTNSLKKIKISNSGNKSESSVN